MTRSLCRRTMVVPLRGGDISRFKPTLSPSSTLPVRAYLAATYTPPPPPSLPSIFTRFIQRAYHWQPFLLFIPLAQPKFSLAITANRILFAIIGGDEPRLPYRVPPSDFLGTVGTPRKLYLFDEVDILGRGTGGVLLRVYIHLQDSSVNSGACSLGNWIRDLIEERG